MQYQLLIVCDMWIDKILIQYVKRYITHWSTDIYYPIHSKMRASVQCFMVLTPILSHGAKNLSDTVVDFLNYQTVAVVNRMTMSQICLDAILDCNQSINQSIEWVCHLCPLGWTLPELSMSKSGRVLSKNCKILSLFRVCIPFSLLVYIDGMF